MKIEFVIHHSFISASFYLFYFGSNSIQICLFCVCLHCFLFIHFIILFCLFVLILFCFVCLIWVWHNGYCTWSAVFIFYWQINYLIKLSFILFNTFIQSIKSFKSSSTMTTNWFSFHSNVNDNSKNSNHHHKHFTNWYAGSVNQTKKIRNLKEVFWASNVLFFHLWPLYEFCFSKCFSTILLVFSSFLHSIIHSKWF